MDAIECFARDLAEDHPARHIVIHLSQSGITLGDFRRLQAEVAALDPSITLEWVVACVGRAPRLSTP